MQDWAGLGLRLDMRSTVPGCDEELYFALEHLPVDVDVSFDEVFECGHVAEAHVGAEDR